MLSTVPFEVPAEFLSRVASGELIRYGTILKDAATGKIAGHMQETGVVQHLFSSLSSGSPLSMALDVVNAGSNVYAGVKIEQLKSMLQVLQGLQVATLGVSIAGIGVSVAGFYYMHKRFTALEGRLDQLEGTIRAGFESMAQRDLRKQLHLTKSLLQRAQHAQTLSDPRPEFSEVAAGLTDQAAYFEGEIAFLVKDDGTIDRELFWQLVQMLMLCNSVRIDCRIRLNELRHALVVSEAVASEYDGLFTHLTPLSFGPDAKEGMATVKVLRDVCDAAACRPYLVDTLRTRRIDGRDYIESIELEKSSPYLFLRPAT